MLPGRDVVSLAAALAAALWSPLAAAEEGRPAAAAEPPPDDLPRFGEEILVTGTRIPRKDLTTPAPVTVISREEIQARGYATLGDFLQSLPEQGNALNRSVNNGFPSGLEGGTFISLRGLGPNRTLVLLNGRRVASMGPVPDVDLSTLPVAVVERVEILKDGASPIYGADALAGVVNVITRKKFDGLEMSAFTGTTTHGDGTNYELSATAGTHGERGQILLSASFSKLGDVMAGDRTFSRFPLSYSATGQVTQQNPRGVKGQFSVGSGILPQGMVYIPSDAKGVPLPNPGGDPRIDLYNRLVTAFPDATSFVRDPGAPLGFRPFLGTQLAPLGEGYNYQPENFLVGPQRQISLFSTGALNVGPRSRVYFEGSYVNRQSSQRYAAFPFATVTEGLVISKDNPYNPFGVDLPDVQRRLTEIGRRGDQNSDSFRAVGGVDGSISETLGPFRGVSWDASLTWSRVNTGAVFNKGLSVPRLAAALGPGFADASAPGGYRCGTPDAPIPGCVPLNLFGPPGSITPEQLAALGYTATEDVYSQMVSGQVNVRSDLFRLLANRPVAIAVGYEYRNVSAGLVPDAVTAAGDGVDGKIPVTRGSYFSNEGYAELSVPIASDLLLVDDLEAMAAVRGFKYSWLPADATYKAGGRWRPVRDVTLRGTWSTAYRAPSVIERFLGEFDQFGFLLDPCADLTAASAARVAACGAAANNGNAEVVVPMRTGGNPALRPETAVTHTAGVVLEPRFVKGLSVTVDYWDISIDHTIDFVNPDAALASCYPTQAGVAPRFCDLIQRDAATQAITGIKVPIANVGKEIASGVDLALRYRLPTALGRFGLSFDGAWLRRHDLFDPDGTVVHGKGTFDLGRVYSGIGGVNPAWKFNAGLSWRLGRVGAAAAVRYIGSFQECGDVNGDFPSLCYLDASFRRTVAPYATADLSASYDLPSPAGHTSITLGVQNVVDSQPPTIYAGFSVQSDPTAYDFAGRFVWLRLTHAL